MTNTILDVRPTVEWPTTDHAGHFLAGRRFLTWANTGTRLTIDACECGETEIGIGHRSQPIRVHLVAQLGHAVEYARIGPETTATGADAVTIGCVCGVTFRMLDDMPTARALHAAHAEDPQPLVVPTPLSAAF